MSKSLLGGVAGATIGFFVGGPTGAKIGWSLGSFLFAESGPDTQGPRLDSLTAESLDYGTPIPIVYGRGRLAGFRYWQRDIIERSHEESQGSKGGGGATNTTYSYYGTFAVGLCEGEVVGVRKVWADAILIYDAGDSAGIETIIASNDASSLFTFYAGSATQEADSLIQATQGSANTPAYRHTASIVFDELPLEKYGNRIPNITCEVIGTGSDLPQLAESWTYNPEISADHGRNEESAWMISASGDDGYISVGSFNHESSDIAPQPEHYYHIDKLDFSGNLIERLTYTRDASSDTAISAERPDGGNEQYLITRNNTTGSATAWVLNDGSKTLSGKGLTVDGSAAWAFAESVYYPSFCDNLYIRGDTLYWGVIATQYVSDIILKYDLGAGLVSSEYQCIKRDVVGVYGEHFRIYVTEDGSTVYVNDYYNSRILELDSNLNEVAVHGTVCQAGSDNIAIEDGKLWRRSGQYVYRYSWPDMTLEKTVGPVSGPDSGRTNRVIPMGSELCAVQSRYWYGIYTASAVSAGTVMLSDIVDDLCDRAGLSAADINTTELTDQVDGYIITSNMSARAAIEPLQKAFFFDGSEFNNNINFIKRGGASIKSIPQDDLGAADYGSDQYALKQTRMQSSELPSDVTIGYISAVRDYEIATQRAQRINYSMPNSIGQELAIVMDDDKGLQIAGITLYNAYVEREKFEFPLTNAHVDLNPTDVITVTHNGDSRVMRLTKLSYGDVIECEAVSDDPQVYTSTATAAVDSWAGQVIGLAGATRIEYMDIPILRNADNDAGLYFSACGYNAAWTGTQIFKSLDSGVTYSAVDSIFTVGTIGNTTDALGDATPAVWDRVSTITIRLVAGALSSATEDNVIRGSNYLLVGSEIIQFANATQNMDGTYTLDTLLRGRRGTEWATGGHSIGDRVVLLSEVRMGRFEAIIGTERDYKAVTVGRYVESATKKSVTNTGASLKPFSVAYPAGSRDGSNNLSITWSRRSRYIGPPLWTRPLYEDAESYEVDVMSGATVLRTISVSSASASYTAAEQTTDGLTPGDPVTVNIYQLSSTVGRGYVTEATI